jgi:hypothetical protein
MIRPTQIIMFVLVIGSVLVSSFGDPNVKVWDDPYKIAAMGMWLLLIVVMAIDFLRLVRRPR